MGKIHSAFVAAIGQNSVAENSSLTMSYLANTSGFSFCLRQEPKQ